MHPTHIVRVHFVVRTREEDADAEVTAHISAEVCTQGAYSGTRFPQGLDTIAIAAESDADLAGRVFELMDDAFVGAGYDGDVVDIVSERISFPDKAVQLGFDACELNEIGDPPCGHCASCLEAVGNWFVEYTMRGGGDRLFLTDDVEVYMLMALE